MNPDNFQISSRLTPIDDAYQTCERTCTVLRVYPATMHPSVVSETLGIKPTRQVVVGESSPINSLGLSRIGKINAWFLSSEDIVESKDMRRHLDWLIAKLQPSSNGLRELQAKPSIRMSVNCIWWSRFGDGGPALWPEQMRALADLNLECSFAFSDYSDEDDDEVEG
jgi:Domain of unknown function (DUF4279)